MDPTQSHPFFSLEQHHIPPSQRPGSVFSGGHWLGGLGNVAVPRSDSDTGAILRFFAEKNGIETSKTSTIVCV
jgi:hypothetical protein